MQLSKIPLILLWVIIPQIGSSQDSDPSILTLERIYTLEEFKAEDIKDLNYLKQKLSVQTIK